MNMTIILKIIQSTNAEALSKKTLHQYGLVNATGIKVAQEDNCIGLKFVNGSLQIKMYNSQIH